jgi:hypothetical protein
MPDPASPSPRSSTLGSLERTYLARLVVTLQLPPDLHAARAVLKQASRAGANVKALYEAAAQIRPKNWPPAPTLAQVLQDPTPPADTASSTTSPSKT